MASFLNLVSTDYLGDLSIHYALDSLVGKYIQMMSGLNYGQSFLITANTDNTHFFIEKVYTGLINGDFETGELTPFVYSGDTDAGYGINLDSAHDGNFGFFKWGPPYRTSQLRYTCDFSEIDSIRFWAKRLLPNRLGQRFYGEIGLFYSPQWAPAAPETYFEAIDRWQRFEINVAAWGRTGVNTFYWHSGGGDCAWYDCYDTIEIAGCIGQSMFDRGFRVGDRYRIHDPDPEPLRVKPSWSIQIGAL